LLTSDFDYDLPPDLIAQEPAELRDGSRMLVVDRAGGELSDRSFGEFAGFLRAGDLLVLNDTRVFPARLRGERAATGGRVEVLFLRPIAGDTWLALTRCGGKLRAGERLVLAGRRLSVRLVERRGGEGDLLHLPAGTDLRAFLEEHGEVPLPPYIRREGSGRASLDRERYQTVYAERNGAVAAPTAGLHFTPEVLAGLAGAGVSLTRLTLHVGPGTFRPVKTPETADHHMDAEWYRLGPDAAGEINRARAAGGRVIAVGTTAVRALETLAAGEGRVRPGEGWTELFIAPPYEFRAVDALLTNFHLPRSTLLMLVSAFAGRELVLRAYRHAVERRYRFYSYGDCCLFL
jgi:S-adenosylmethionine:tRNA ribosyltransferase-isomerase